MKKIFILFAAISFISLGKIYAYDDGDFQVWNIENQEFNITKKTKVALEEEFRWGDNARDFYYHHYDLGLVHSLNKYLSVGGGYRQVYEKKKGKFKEENEPYGLVALFGDLAGWKFDSRNRLEYRHFDYQTDSWRYRNKFTVRTPWKFTKLEIQPFVGDEIFFDLTAETLNKNRAYAGLAFTLLKNLKEEIYYLLETSKSSTTCVWTDTNVLVTKLKLSF